MDGDKIYRLPPMKLGPKVYLASELGDVIDWGLKGHGIPAHWSQSQGENILVGVCDTGRPTHPDVASAVKHSKNFSSSHTDVDEQGHSTHVCGTIAAARNGQGVVGVAPGVSLCIAKVLGDDGSGDNVGVAKGIRYCLDQGCDIISMSLGGSYDRAIANAVKDAVAAGKFVICAAGNEGEDGNDTVGYPAKLNWPVAVASYRKDGKLSGFSSRGKQVDIAFPGEDILSTWLNGGYRRISGTSMATPFCSGVVALMLSRHRKLIAEGKKLTTPITNNAELLEHLKRHAVDRGPKGFDIGWGWGVLDVDKFLKTEGKAVTPAPEKPAELQINLPFGIVANVKTPVEYDGKVGAFVYIS